MLEIRRFRPVAVAVAIAVLVCLTLAGLWGYLPDVRRPIATIDEYVPTESHVVNVYPELRVPNMTFAGIWGDMDLDAMLFKYTGSVPLGDEWSDWLAQLERSGWKIALQEQNETHLRRIKESSRSRRIAELRTACRSGGTIVVAIIERHVDKSAVSLDETSIAEWLQRAFWPRFRAAIDRVN